MPVPPRSPMIAAITQRYFVLIVAFTAPVSVFAEHQQLADLPLEDLLRITLSSATRFEQPTTEAPATVTVINDDEIQRHAYRNLAQALTTVPGVYSSNDRNYTYLGVRGFNRPGDYGTRILLLTDGARRNDPLYDQALFGNESPIEIDWVKRLEFVSGPASALYGANALFGTANAVMLEGKDINGARLTVDGGSFNTRRIGIVAGREFENNQDLFVGFSSYRSRGEDLNFNVFGNGQANGLDGETYHKAYGKYRWGNWRLTGNYSWREKNDPTANFGTSFGTAGTNMSDQNRLIDLRYEGNTNQNWQPSFRIYNGNYRFTGNYMYSASPNSRDTAKADWSGAEFRITYTGFNHHKLLAGIETQRNQQLLQRYAEISTSTTILDTNNPSRSQAIYLQDEWRLHPDWLLNVGVRYDKHNQFSGVTSPRIALIWQTTQRLTLKAITGSAYRIPNVFERYYSDNGASQSANPALRAEHIQTREIAATYRIGQAGQTGMSLYDNQIRDLIDQTPNGTGGSIYWNQSKVNSRGLELSAENRWSGDFRLRGSIAWQHSEMTGSGAALVDSPRRTGKLIASAPIASGWTAAGEFFALSNRLSGTTTVPGYGTLNFTVTAPGDKRYGQVSLSINNLTNRTYFDPASPSMRQTSVEQSGRQLRLRWTLAL